METRIPKRERITFRTSFFLDLGYIEKHYINNRCALTGWARSCFNDHSNFHVHKFRNL